MRPERLIDSSSNSRRAASVRDPLLMRWDALQAVKLRAETYRTGSTSQPLQPFCLPALVLASVLRRRDVSVQFVDIDEDAAGLTSFLL